MKNTINKKGITLIALIITIIVLLILAILAISAVSGDGIIEYAKDAKLKTQIAQEEEKVKLAVQESYVSNLGNIDYSELARILGEGYTIQDGICTTPSGNKIKIEADGTVSKFEELKVNAEGSLFNFEYNDEAKTASITGFKKERINATWYEWNTGSYVNEYSYLMDENGNKLTTIDIPATVVYNGTEYTVTVVSGMSFRSGGGDIEEANVVSVNIPTTIKEIGYGCFDNFTKLSEVNILSSEINSVNSAFLRTPWLQNQYKINSGLLILNNTVLQADNTMTSMTIPETVTTIADGVFSYFTELEEVTLPKSLTNIGDKVFYACNNLKTINNFPQNLEDEKFISCFFEAFNGMFITQASPWFVNKCSNSNGLYSYKNVLIASDYNELGSEVKVPEGITAIKSGAFFFANHINTLEIPSSVIKIDSDAFYNTFSQGIEKIKIYKAPNSISGAPWGAVKSQEESSVEPTIEWLGNE